MDPVLNSHFNKFKQAFDIVTIKGSLEEQKRNEAHAFEKFANYVLFSLDDPDVFTSDTELLDSVCVGGDNDTVVRGRLWKEALKYPSYPSYCLRGLVIILIR